MVFEKATIFFGKVRKRLGEKSEKLREIKLEDIAKFAAKEAAGAIPVVGPIIKGAFDEFLPDEKEELLKELNELSESQFKEIGEKVGVSVEYLMDIREITLYSFGELQADHEEIKELIRSLIEIITRVEITIPSIQSVLEKDEIPDGEFSRTEPKWIDFEEDFVVEREEVDEIINKLENNNIQLVLGKPASGKSVILKNIGFKLAKKGRSVYIIELKKWSADRVESYFKEAQKIDDEGTLIIVDDAHLPEKLSKCEELIRDYRYKKLRTKLIIGAREVKGLKGSRKKASEFEKLVQTKIRAIDAAEQMIYLFLNKKYGVSYKLRIAAVSSGLEEYKNDPWSLSWALNVFDKDTDTVRKEDIYSAINEDITEIKDGEDVFLPLSVFYRFEIPIEKRFLTKQLEIDKYSIDDLIGISEIREIKERGITMLALHHSSLASLYFETYQRTDLFPELGENIKERINEQSKYDDWERGLFYLYLKSEPTNSLDVLIRLADDWEDIKGGQALLKKLIKDERSKNSIKEGIRKEKNREKFVLCVEYITAASEEEALELVDAVSARIFFPPQIIKGRITTKKVTVGAKTGVVISGITSEEVTPDTIEHFLERIASINKKVAQEILNYLNRLSLHQKLDLKITTGFPPAWWIIKSIRMEKMSSGTKSSRDG